MKIKKRQWNTCENMLLIETMDCAIICLPTVVFSHKLDIDEILLSMPHKLLFMWVYIYIYIYIYKVKLATVVENDLKAPFSIARGGYYSFPWIALLYPWYMPYNAES